MQITPAKILESFTSLSAEQQKHLFGQIKQLFKDTYETFDEKVTGYASDTIVYNNTVYKLRFPLRCKMEITDNKVVIENEILGIFAFGKNQEEAKKDFCEEFDYIYKRYNELPKEKLMKDVLSIRDFINYLVNENHRKITKDQTKIP